MHQNSCYHLMIQSMMRGPTQTATYFTTHIMTNCILDYVCGYYNEFTAIPLSPPHRHTPPHTKGRGTIWQSRGVHVARKKIEPGHGH